jgi:hypothetical protein
VLAGWVIGLGLLCVWYSEHVKLNAKIVELNGALIALAERERERERERQRERERERERERDCAQHACAADSCLLREHRAQTSCTGCSLSTSKWRARPTP